MSKKVLYINSTLNVGSTGKIVEGIALLAKKNGYLPYAAYGRSEHQSKIESYKIGNKIDFIGHALQSRLLDAHGLGSKNATKKFLEYVSSLNPDIIHLHNIHGYYLNYQMLFSYLSSSKIPVVWTLHDCWSFTGHCAYYTFVKCQKWKKHCHACPQKHTYPKSAFVDKSKQNFSLKSKTFLSLEKMILTPVSHWLSNELESSFLQKKPKKVIHNGINLNKFYNDQDHSLKKKYNLKGKLIVLGVASKWEHRKGLQDFIKLKDFLDENYQIILIGLNEKQMSQLPKGIIGISRTENIDELRHFYSMADIFINPTLEDNYPTTNLEAIACGTPVITYNTGGSIESIVEGETGHITKNNTPQGIKDCLDQFTNNKKEVDMKQMCISYAKSNFDETQKFKEYIDLYNSLII